MIVFTIDDIRAWRPCYDPSRHLPEGWSGTALDLLRMESIPPNERLWAVGREAVVDARILHLFAVWCARQVQHLLTDQRSRDALDMAERYATDKAPPAVTWMSVVAAARIAGWAASSVTSSKIVETSVGAAAWAAARAAAWAAARAAAGARIRTASSAASRAAAEAAIRTTAWEAARAAAWEAAGAMAWDSPAGASAWAAALAAAGERQVQRLIGLIVDHQISAELSRREVSR